MRRNTCTFCGKTAIFLYFDFIPKCHRFPYGRWIRMCNDCKKELYGDEK